jgi:hypothetical protein
VIDLDHMLEPLEQLINGEVMPIARLIFTDPYGKPADICHDWIGSYDKEA